MLGSNNLLYKYVNNSWTQISTPAPASPPNNTYLTSVAFNHGTFYLLYNGGINGAIYGSPLAGLNESTPNNWSLLIESQLQGALFNGDVEADYYGNVYVDVGPDGSPDSVPFLDKYFLALPAASN